MAFPLRSLGHGRRRSFTRRPRRNSSPDLRRLLPGRKVSHEPGNRQPVAGPNFPMFANGCSESGVVRRAARDEWLDAIIVVQD
jgi:hypothetical protein